MGERSKRPDVQPLAVIDLTGRASPKEFGPIWRLTDERGGSLCDPFPGLSAIVAGQGCQVRLECHDADSPRLLDSGRTAATSRYHRALPRLFQLARQLVVRALKASAMGGVTGRDAPVPTARPVRTLRGLAQGHLRAARGRIASQLIEDNWQIGIVDAPIARFLDERAELPVTWLGPRDRRGFLADPFGLPDRADEILCEALDHARGVGSIVKLTLAGARIVSRQAVPLVPGVHLSYPFVFADQGRVYCIPESHQARSCILHERQADGVWRPVATLLDGVAARDTTLFRHGGRYWLAYGDTDVGDDDNLCLAFADRLPGPYRRHRLNPVKIDHHSARPGGTLFEHEGRLYRPAQDCSTTYGGALVIHHVRECSETTYVEEPVRLLRPERFGPNWRGVHTLSAWGERTLVDGKTRGFNPRALRRKMARRFLGFATPATD